MTVKSKQKLFLAFSVQESRANEEKNIKVLTEDIANLDIKIAKATEELEKKKQEKHREHHKLHKLQVYESFLEKVMISSQDYEKDEKKRENIKKMIERYRLLIDKQKSLKEETYRRDEERVPLGICN